MAKWHVIEHGNKKLLVKQHSSETDAELVVKTQDNELLSIRRTQILASMPSKPAYGRVFGVLVEPLLKVVEHPYFGEVRLYRNNKDDLAKLKRGMGTIAARLAKVKINLPEHMQLSSELRHNTGKKYGMFRGKLSNGEFSGLVTVCTPEGASQGIVDYVLAHECGHGVWWAILSWEQRARWISLFATQAKLQPIEPAKIQEVRKHFLGSLKRRQFEDIDGYRSMLEPDSVESEVFELALGNVLATYRLKPEYLDRIMASRGFAMFQACWPKSHQDSDFEIPVTEYGTKNPDEFFAEAFTYWLFGYKMNERVEKLMTACIGVPKPSASKLESLPEGVSA